MPPHLVGGAVGNDLTLVVLGEEQGEATLAPDALDEMDRLPRLLGGHAGGGLVEEKNGRLQGERDAQLDLLLVAVGEEARDLARLVEEADGGEQGLRLLAIQPLHGGEKVPAAPAMREKGGLDVLVHGELGEDVRALEGAAHAQAAEIVRRDARDLAIVEAHAARVGTQMPRDQVEERGLARAVGADDGADRAAGHAEAHAAHGLEAREALAEALDLKHGPRLDGSAGGAVRGRPRCRPGTRRGGPRGWCRGRAASTPCTTRSAG